MLWAALGLSVGGQAHAAALMQALFQDHAVLQRDRPIEVWGHAAGGEVVTVSLADSSVTAHADASGQWSAVLPARSAGGPYVLTARGSSGAQQTANDVLVGDVFLCSGQSNMELPVKRSGNSDAEIRNSANDTIRMLTVTHASSMAPRGDFADPVSWQRAAPATVPEWSATCFYFARELQKLVHVPMGLVHSSWGGANIRPWISAATLHASGNYESELGVLALYAKDPAAAQERFGKQWEQWWRGKTGDKPGTEPWQVAAPGGDRSRGSGDVPGGDWQPGPAELGDWRYWGVPQLQDFSGVLWYRTVITLSAARARTATRLDLGAINQVDETWINGRVLGNTFGYDADRSYNIRPGMLHAGANVLVVNANSDYGSRGMLAGGKPRALYFSDGASVALHGPWQYRIVPGAVGYPPRSPWEPVGGITTLYNAMIAPLGHFGFKAALWYQGESNTNDPGSYEGLLASLMADWRRQFGAGLPFLIVQLPNYGPLSSQPVESHWAQLREAQKQAVAKDPHAALAVTIDIGEPDNLHPTNKQDVGMRLAHAARPVVYGESIAPSGPVATRAMWSNGAVVVDFTDIEQQLVAYSHQTPIAFELCDDAPGSCQFAAARIEGNTVVLSVPAGGTPTRVRYCWGDSPVCTLFDSNGLPAGPFEIRISVAAPAATPARAATPQASRPPITGISHIAVYAAAPEKSERFYVHDLGAVKGPDPENPRGIRYYFSPTQFVEVLPLPDGPASGNRLDHVAFTTTDVARLHNYLHVAQQVTTGSDGSQWLTINDPEGNRVEFVQPGTRVPDIPVNPLSSHIIHVGFIIHDRAREDEFFKATLGFRPYWFGGMTDNKTQWISQQVPDGTDWLEYMVVSSQQISAADRGVLNHFSLGVPDMEAAYTLLWNGARLDGQTNTPKIGRDAKWQLNLIDPDGTRAEIMEFHAIGTPCCSPFTAPDPQK